MNSQTNIDQYLQFAESQLVELEFAPLDARGEILIKIKDKLIQAETIQKGSGSWLMACTHARMLETELCVRWLERARKNGALPDKEKVQTSSYFKGFRDEPWFVEFVEGVGN